MKIERVNVIDFNSCVGKKISEVKTLWSQLLIEFHHELFEKIYKLSHKDYFYDASAWFKRCGGGC